MKNKLFYATTALISLAAMGTAHAESSVALFGQVEKMVIAYDDGKNTDTSFADNTIGGTLFGFEGERNLDNGLTASVLFEVAIGDPATGDIQQSTTAGQSSTPAAGVAAFGENMSRVGLGGDWGALFLGRQDMAADGVTKEDLGGAGDLLISETTMIGGNLLFRNGTTGASTGVTVGSVMTNNDVENLVNGVRYDTPTINGFMGSVSAEQGGSTEAAIRYAGEFGGISVSSAIGYKSINDAATAASNVDEDVVKAGVSVKHESGLAGSLAYGKTSRALKAATVDDATSYYAKVSYEWDQFAVAADYGVSNDLLTTVTSSEAKAIGVAATMDLGHGVSTGLLWRQFSMDDSSAVDYDNISLFGWNLGVKF